jgi:hypothetical protein
LVFLSDLHLATDNGKRDFFAEDEFTALLDELIDDHEPIDLIIAGDFFDLLQLTAETPGADRVATFQRAFEQREYEGMLDRLRHFNRQPEHRTIYLLGNHDAESGWNDPLRAYLLDSGIVSEISLAYAHTYGDGLGNGCLIYCEHGNDYDGVNTIIDYRNPSITPLGSHIVTDMVNYLEPLGRHADIDAPTSIADIDNIHPLGLIPWWFISTYFYQQVRRITKYIVVPASVIYLLFHLLPLYLIFEQFHGTFLARGLASLPNIELIVAGLIIMFDSSLLVGGLIWILIRFDFARTRRRYGLQDPDDIFRRGARHYRRTCEELVSGALRPVHWPAEEPWSGADLFVYGHTHTQDLTTHAGRGCAARLRQYRDLDPQGDPDRDKPEIAAGLHPRVRVILPDGRARRRSDDDHPLGATEDARISPAVDRTPGEPLPPSPDDAPGQPHAAPHQIGDDPVPPRCRSARHTRPDRQLRSAATA